MCPSVLGATLAFKLGRYMYRKQKSLFKKKSNSGPWHPPWSSCTQSMCSSLLTYLPHILVCFKNKWLDIYSVLLNSSIAKNQNNYKEN